MKYNYRIPQRVYASTYANIAEQFKIYVNSLPPDEIDETENDLEQMETASFLLTKRKVQPNYLILLQCFTISTAGFSIQMDIFLFPMLKLLESLEKFKP